MLLLRQHHQQPPSSPLPTRDVSDFSGAPGAPQIRVCLLRGRLGMLTITFTMELALNLIWLCLALAGFALMVGNLSWAAKPADRQPTNRQKIVAMSCALIILFFVVSMTDDLHDQEIFVEETKFLKVINGTGSPAMGAAHSAVASPLFLYFDLPGCSPTFTLPAVRRLLQPTGFSLAAALSFKT